MMHQRRGFHHRKVAPLLITMLLLFSAASQAQVYQLMPNRYEIRESIFDSSFGLPYGATPSLRGSLQPTRPGRLFYSTADSSVKVWTGTQYLNVGGGAQTDWGDIGGTIADQTDLMALFNTKLNVSDTTLMLSHYLRSSDTAWLHNAVVNLQTFTNDLNFTNGLSKTGNQVVALYQQSIWNAGQIQGFNVSATAPTNGQVLKWSATNNRYEPGAASGGSSVNNANIGSGYRVLNPGTQEMRTLFGSFGVNVDSSINTNGLTWKIDSTLWTTLNALRDTANALRTDLAGGGGSQDLQGVLDEGSIANGNITLNGSFYGSDFNALDNTATLQAALTWDSEGGLVTVKDAASGFAINLHALAGMTVDKYLYLPDGNDGDTLATQDWVRSQLGSGGGGVSGIDDVLAAGQALTADREMDASNHIFNILLNKDITWGDSYVSFDPNHAIYGSILLSQMVSNDSVGQFQISKYGIRAKAQKSGATASLEISQNTIDLYFNTTDFYLVDGEAGVRADNLFIDPNNSGSFHAGYVLTDMAGDGYTTWQSPRPLIFTPSSSTDNTHPTKTLAADNTYLYFRTSSGTWVKMAWTPF